MQFYFLLRRVKYETELTSDIYVFHSSWVIHTMTLFVRYRIRLARIVRPFTLP
jgi:hypothetical protein